MNSHLKLGVSSCLLGNPVRYDGGHKRNDFIVDILGNHVEFVPVCPEYEAGFGVPREAMRLQGSPGEPRLVTQKTKIDHTDRMHRWIEKRLRTLENEDLDGFIFKSGSPSSGMERVKVYDDKGNSHRTGSGLFARAFMERFPLVLAEDEGRLNDIGIRENFIVRLFAFRRWKDQCAGDATPAALISFHARHKYLLMAHNPAAQKDLGKLVAGIKGQEPKRFRGDYVALFMKALRSTATVKKNANVLLHMAGYFRNKLAPDDIAELHEIIEQYRRGNIPLIVPVTLIRHYGRTFNESYLMGQYYLEPHPLELKLRNHA